jgi:hypothetical protein
LRVIGDNAARIIVVVQAFQPFVADRTDH